MKQAKVKQRQSEAWQNTLSRINEATCPTLFYNIKEIVRYPKDETPSFR